MFFKISSNMGNHWRVMIGQYCVGSGYVHSEHASNRADKLNEEMIEVIKNLSDGDKERLKEILNEK